MILAEAIFPKRQRCKTCGKKLEDLVILGLYDSYRCAGLDIGSHSKLPEELEEPVHLYIKTHRTSGLRYFGRTKNDPYSYFGSGIYWNKHLEKHGYEVDTQVFGTFLTKVELVTAAIEFSLTRDIVTSESWANSTIETGLKSMIPGKYDWDKKYRLNKKEIQDFISAGLTTAAIAEHYGCSKSLVRKYSQEHNLTLNIAKKTGAKRSVAIPPKSFLTEMYCIQELSCFEISKKLGCSESSVRNLLSYHQIPLRERAKKKILIDPQVLQYMVNEYSAGKTTVELEATTEIPRQVIADLLKNAGVYIKNGRRNEISKEKLIELLIVRKTPIQRIAKELNIDRKAIYRAIDENNFVRSENGWVKNG